MTGGAGRSIDPFGLAGQTLAGRFRIDRHVAEGGFGVIYQAHQLVLDRPVALKVFKPSADLRGEAFESEARIVARLKHSSIVEVYDFGVTERPPFGPLRWMALEWLEGRTLDAFLAEASRTGEPPMQPAAALALLRPVLQAMASCHRQGVVHRDLKPENILLAEVHGAVLPKVLDFGIAQMLARGSGERSGPSRTTRGLPAFSPDYAAPEQVSYGRTGPWTDVHALGLILSEMLTGEPPYGRGEAQERFAAAVSEQRPTPGHKGVAVSDWELVLAKALARRPADRYPDAEALLTALENPEGAGNGTRRSLAAVPGARRRQAILAATSTAGLAAVALLGWRLLPLWQPARVTQSARVRMAVLPFENLTDDPQQEYFSNGLTEGMISQLGRLSPGRLAVIARTSVEQYRHSSKTAKEIGRELAVGYLLECAVARAGGRLRVDARLIDANDETQVWAESYDRDIKDVLVLQSELAKAIASEVQIKLSPEQATDLARKRSVKPAAYDAYLRGRSLWEQKTAEGHAQALAYFEEAIRIDPSYPAAYVGLADVYSLLPMNGNARMPDVAGRAKAAAVRAVELDDSLADAHVALAFILEEYEWDWPGAGRHFRRALELDPNNVEAHRRYGQVYLNAMGRHDEAIAELKRALELAPLSPSVNLFLGRAYYFARRYDESIAQLKRTIATYGDGASFLVDTYVAKRLYAEAMTEAEKCAGGCVPLRAYVNARAGRPAEALRLLQQIDPVPRGGRHYTQLARVHAGLDQRDEAFAILEQAYRERDYGLLFLRVDPAWDPLRADPRFADLVRKVGIPSR